MAKKCTALYVYDARDSEELSILKSDPLEVVDDGGTWWKVRNEAGQEGLVPSNYVELVVVSPPGPSRTNLADEPSHMYHQPDLMVRSNGPSLNIKAVAKFKYAGTREDELSLEKGDEVIVMEKEADGWWRGRCGARIGWFPFNYVTEKSELQQQQPAKQPEKSFICGVISLYSFTSGNPEELQFQKGDLLDIVDQPSDDPDWWEARKADGTTGLVPRNYVDVVHDADPVFGRSPASAGGGGGVSNLPAAGRVVQGPQHMPPFAHEPWYHGRVARKDAEAVLNSQAANGQFIVRSSETKPGDYSISMKAPDRIKHFNVKNLPDGRLGIGQRKFDSMDELIQHYRRAPIYTTNTEGKMYLGTGLPRR